MDVTKNSKAVKMILKLIVLLIGITVITSGLLVYIKSNGIVMKQTEQSILELTRSEQGLVSNLVQDQWVKTDLMATRPDFVELLSAESGLKQDINLRVQVNSELKEYVKRTGDLEHAFVVDKKGIIVADSDEHLIGVDINDRNYVNETLSAGKAVVSETLVSKSTGEQIIVFTEPIRKNGQTLGFVGSAVYIKSFAKSLNEIKVQGTASSYFYLVDSKGNMLYHPTKEKIGKPVENAQIQEVVKTLQSGANIQPAVVNYILNGTQILAAYHVVPETQWILVLAADKGEILAPLKAMNFYNLGVGLVALIIATLLGDFLIARLLLR